jgi:AAA+ ATPase superfamily predicted ATPase
MLMKGEIVYKQHDCAPKHPSEPMQVFSRELEQGKIRQLMASEKPELAAVYGRRRVGKTFTVSQTLKENPAAIYFEFTGNLLEDGRPLPFRDFLTDFSVAWYACRGTRRNVRSVEDCLLALVDLASLSGKQKPLYLFLDELPWIARSAPEFFRGLVTLWNNTLARNPHVKLFVAGSATSWMIDEVIQAKTGLAKRVTAKIHMRALDLAQTGKFLSGKGMDLSHNDAFRIYSVLGGIPYYLDALDTNLSPNENLYNLLVRKDGLLYAATEYEQVFLYLFSRDTSYKKVIDVLVDKKYGLSLAELAKAIESKDKPSGNLRRILQNLAYSDLIDRRATFLNRSKGVRHFVTDEYMRFVSRWLTDSEVTTYGAFNRIFSSQSYAAWQGFDFELIAFKNSHLIAAALGISGISIEPFIYYQDDGVQIDLLLARGDRTLTICEAKSCDGEYEPVEKDVARFRARKRALQQLLKIKRKSEEFINYCFITRNGVKRNRYFNEINPLVVDLSLAFALSSLRTTSRTQTLEV